MYFATVVLLLLVLPVLSVAVQMAWGQANDVLLLVGKWFVFWGVGVRLFIAGLRQVMQPQFTAEEIFEIKDRSAFAIVRELGFANLSMGALGLLSLWRGDWLVPAAIAGGLYYGLAGVGHIGRGSRNFKENVALVSDLFIFILLVVFVARRGF